jgi:hypothetical protein
MRTSRLQRCREPRPCPRGSRGHRVSAASLSRTREPHGPLRDHVSSAVVPKNAADAFGRARSCRRSSGRPADRDRPMRAPHTPPEDDRRTRRDLTPNTESCSAASFRELARRAELEPPWRPNRRRSRRGCVAATSPPRRRAAPCRARASRVRPAGIEPATFRSGPRCAVSRLSPSGAPRAEMTYQGGDLASRISPYSAGCFSHGSRMDSRESR